MVCWNLQGKSSERRCDKDFATVHCQIWTLVAAGILVGPPTTFELLRWLPNRLQGHGKPGCPAVFACDSRPLSVAASQTKIPGQTHSLTIATCVGITGNILLTSLPPHYPHKANRSGLESTLNTASPDVFRPRPPASPPPPPVSRDLETPGLNCPPGWPQTRGDGGLVRAHRLPQRPGHSL